MAGGKETPRQKMIGMMYLVLTALLALNVSKEILNAFVIVEDGLNTTNVNFDGKNGVLYNKFAKTLSDNQAKTKPWYDKAMQVKKESEQLCKLIDDIRSELYLKVQKLPSKEVADTFKLKMLDSKDNYDIPTHYLLGETPEEPKEDAKSMELKNAIIKYKSEIVKNPTGLSPEQIKNFEKEKSSLKLGLNTDDVYSISDEKIVHWEFNNFDHTTMAADMCIFAALKNDVKNAESDVINLLLKQVTAADFSFDAVEAKVVAPSSYIISGEKYTADIFVSAHSSTQNPEVVIGSVDTSDSKMPKIKGDAQKVNVVSGVGKYEVQTGAEGEQTYSGLINVKGPTGEIKSYRFSQKYTVAKPAMSVSPTKMNVFYIGVDNPVDITVAGAAPKDVTATLSGGVGTIKDLGQGHYTVTVKSGDAKGMINVNVTTKINGLSKNMGMMAFRVRPVPSPLGKFAGIVGDGAASKGELMAAAGAVAELKDFVFDLKFPVVSWKLGLTVNGLYVSESATGPGTTSAMKALLEKAKKGSKVLIEEFKVQAPGEVRKIPGVIITVK